MKIETERLIITEFTMDMAEAVHLNSLDEDNRRFVPDEVFETVEEAADTVGFLTDAPFGIPQFINGIKNLDKEFYLVEKDGKQLFVTVTDEFIETRQLAKPITDSKFEIGNWKFTKCAYNVSVSSGRYEK